ncbi:MAG TPA: tetratricopeptide repeat protein [Steroidobacteraceae bacterium]|jgi:tetratricopeptide (TPR) repeat protein|nr:tetratricopeptide repeat protein [Steroidobacteraceae bacterium]
MRRISGLLQAGQFRDAHAQLESLLAANPGYVEGLRLLAGAKQALGDTAQAESVLRRALEIDPASVPTLTTLAELLLQTGRRAEAVPLLERALQGSPPYLRAALLLTRYYLDTGQPARALEVATPWCHSGKADLDLAALHVAAYAALGRLPEAVAHYRERVGRSPDDSVAAHTLAVALNTAQQPAEAERVLRQTLLHSRPSAALHYTLARSLLSLERFDEAELALRECVRLDPRRAETHDRLAQLVWRRSGDIAAAARSLTEALEKFPHDDALRGTKAALLQGAGDARGAFACLSERAARPDSHPSMLIRAGLAALEFEPATALRLAERALRALPADHTARRLLCAACLGVGDGKRALTECATLLEATPDQQYLIAMQTTALRLLHDPRYESFCDYDRMVLSMPIETPAGWGDLGSFLTEVAARLGSLHNPHGHRLLFQSLRLGTETTQDLSRSPDPVIQALFRAFAAPIARYREHIGQGEDALRRRNRGPARFNGGWSVRLHSDGYHTSHVHPRGWISSAFYVQLPDSMRAGHTGEGILSFGAPGMLTTPSLPAELSVRPEVGLLVLFPSYFWHGTLPFHADQPRLTVAFDAVPDRE